MMTAMRTTSPMIVDLSQSAAQDTVAEIERLIDEVVDLEKQLELGMTMGAFRMVEARVSICRIAIRHLLAGLADLGGID